jgi:hypothetical protein
MRHVRIHRLRLALVLTLILLLAGVVLNLLLSATPALPVSLLLVAAALDVLVLLLIRTHAARRTREGRARERVVPPGDSPGAARTSLPP